MAYLTPANFRPLTALYPDVVLTVNEVTDARLTTEIATQSAVFDRETGDHFETVTGATIDYPVSDETILVTRGQRIQAVTTVSEVGLDGVTLTPLDATTYRVRPWGLVKLDGYPFGTYGQRSVRLAGLTYGWTATPGDVKRAIAVLVWDALKAKSADRMRATRWRAGETMFERQDYMGYVTGIREVDDVIRRYRSMWRPRLLSA